MKAKILIFSPFYLPSVKGGGPIQSIKNLVDNLSLENEFYIITSDRDLGDEGPFEEIERNIWTSLVNTKVMYVESKKINLKFIKEIIKKESFDYVYLNSFFNFRFSILPVLGIKATKKLKPKIIIAPRGEFSQGAIKFKKKKKSLFVNIYKLLNLQKNIIWHATTEIEEQEIHSVFGEEISTHIANNLTSNYQSLDYNKKLEKFPLKAKFIFISRISPKKNLHGALKALSNLKGDVIFSIYGPKEDSEYWELCKEIIDTLPSNIQVNYFGILNHEEVLSTFRKHHFFLFPTLGENYGHVISEALLGGCPVILSDQTPWTKLQENEAGWNIPLDEETKYKDVLQECVNMNNREYLALSKSAFLFGKQESNSAKDVKETAKMFTL